MNEEKYPGVKHDQGKPKFSLMPPLSELEVVKTLTFGAEKYAPDNWRGIAPIRYVDAAGRHINAHRRGEPMDAESGLHHLAHAICCLMFQLEKELERELEYGQVQPCDMTSVNPVLVSMVNAERATEPEKFTVTRQESKSATADDTKSGTALTETYSDEFSMSNPPLIGQGYHYLSNTGVIATRRWQSTPQEWNRLHKGQVFKGVHACWEKGYHTPYIFHEDDPVRYPEIGDQVWLIRKVVNGENDSWVVDSKPYRVVSTDIGPGATDLTINHAKGWHEQGKLFHSKEQAEAKALWRNLSMQRHGTPYGPLHPDAKQYDEPLSGNDEGEEHD